MVTPGLAFINMVSTAASVGIAVLGRGGFAAFFSHQALLVLAIATFLMAGIGLFSCGNLSTGVREDRANRWIFAPLALIGLLAAYLPAYTDRKEFWTLDGDTIRWLGPSPLTMAHGLQVYVQATHKTRLKKTNLKMYW